jgi:hypothetical protein
VKSLLYVLAASWLGNFAAFSETLVLHSGSTIEGIVIRTNGDTVLLLTDYGTYGFSKTSIKDIEQEAESPAETPRVGRLSSFQTTILLLNQQTWSSNLKQIPATVIDKGVFKNVPYTSFRCGDDYEVNIYGDLKNPAAIEAGVYRTLLNDDEAKRNCLNFITGLLNQADKEIVQSLNLGKDIKERDGLSFEITPPYAEDAYLGWWISVYSEKKLNRSRASEKEMANISVSKTVATPSEEVSAWSADEMKLARSQPETITFVNSTGTTVSNAVVVRVVDGAYLIWRQGASGGMVKLSDLPDSIRTRFGYDQSKATAIYSANEYKREAAAQAAVLASHAQPEAFPVSRQTDFGSYSSGGAYSSYVPSGGGRVYVRGYTRKDGTYVQPHTRNAPR